MSITAGAAERAEHPGLAPAEQKILEALDGIGRSKRELIDRVAGAHGHGLHLATAQKALDRLTELGLAQCIGAAANLANLWKASDDT